MHKILTDLLITGDVTFTGSLNGNIPFVLPETTKPTTKTFQDEDEYNVWLESLYLLRSRTKIEIFKVNILSLIDEGERVVQISPASNGLYIKVQSNTKESIKFVDSNTSEIYDISDFDFEPNQQSLTHFDTSNSSSLAYITNPSDNLQYLSSPISTDSGNTLIKKENGLFVPQTSNIIYLTEKTDYNTITENGWYSVKGVDFLETSTYHAPYSSTTDVILQVHKYNTINNIYVVQLAYGSTQYGSIVRNSLKIRTGINGNMPLVWDNIDSTQYLSDIFVKTGSIETLDASPGYGGSRVFGYKPSELQIPESAPTNQEGTAIWFQSGYKNYTIGSYAGFTLASDVDGRIFLNVENNQPTDTKQRNWKEILTLDSPVLISTDANNALVKRENGLYVPPAPASDVVVSADNQNQLTNLVVGDNPGLYARPVSIQLLPDDSIYRAANTSNPKNTDIRVNISQEPYNLLKLSGTSNKGLYVAANAPAIPKFSAGSLTTLFSSATIYPNGHMKFTETMDLPNPTGVTSYNNISLYNNIRAELGHYYLDASGNPIPTNITAAVTRTTSSVVSVSVTVFVYGTPALAFDPFNDAPYPSEGVAPSQLNIKISLLVGTTLANAYPNQ